MSAFLSQAELEKVIEEAFASTKPPTSEILIYPRRENEAEVRAVFENKIWQEVSLKTVYNGNPILSIFLSHEAFRYFYPAYMLAAVRDIKSNRPDLMIVMVAVQSLKNISHLAATDQANYDNLYRERVSGFSEKQRKTIIAFLQYIKTTPTPSTPILWNEANLALKDLAVAWGDI